MPENGSPDVTVPADAGDPGRLPPEINVTVAHPARVYDYLLGGVDNDPIVLAHARALMASDPAGATAFIGADVRDPDTILSDPALRRTLDLGEPVALMLIAILMYIRDEDNPRGLVSALMDALPSGSYLAITHPTADFSPDEVAGAVAATEQGGISFTPRTQAEVAAFFDGLDLVDPGVVPIPAWHLKGIPPVAVRAAYYYGAMGRKP